MSLAGVDEGWGGVNYTTLFKGVVGASTQLCLCYVVLGGDHLSLCYLAAPQAAGWHLGMC